MLYKKRKSIHVDELLKYSFVSPNHSLLGKVGGRQSLDGWRDDQFPRKVDYLTSSLKILEEIVKSGKAVAYLPEYFGKRLNLEIINVSGCPHTCNQKINTVAHNPKRIELAELVKDIFIFHITFWIVVSLYPCKEIM